MIKPTSSVQKPGSLTAVLREKQRHNNNNTESSRQAETNHDRSQNAGNTHRHTQRQYAGDHNAQTHHRQLLGI